ncbi:MAG: cell wall hydrolase [Lachnospiraceae bacterium]|nr:cell wall hydrolase [Lachnospiraceae bacterium]
MTCKRLAACFAAAIMICTTMAIPVKADETTVPWKEQPDVNTARGEDQISPRALLGSLNQTEEGQELLSVLDETNGNIADTDLEFEAAIRKSSYKKSGFSKKDLKYLSAIIYCEANSQVFDSKVAVANTVLNRMRNENPNEWGHVSTIYEVIYDRRWGVQFSPTSASKGKTSSMDKALNIYAHLDDGTCKDWEVRAMKNCIEAAKAALAGYRSIPESFMFFNSHLNTQPGKCLDKEERFIILDKHIYYTENRYENQ